MGGKHKRKVREEKSKTKLKGSKLLKGLNITKTYFKVKKIVIREQLKQFDSNEAHSSRNLNVKDCITRLQHHNSSFRTEALRNLKEIITHYPGEIIEKHLAEVIQNLAKLSLDLERDIRRDSVKCLDSVLTIAPSDHVKPFFEVLSSFTRCAMTHIQVNVQEDSLLLLDVLITNIPELISLNRDKIFSSFLNMMSKLKNESKPDRTVTVNLGTKQTSVKWRIQILIRLNRMLGALIQQKIQKSSHNFQEIKNTGENLIENAFMTGQNEQYNEKSKSSINFFHPDKPMIFPLIYAHSNKICSIPKLLNKSVICADDHLDDGSKVQNYATTLMPLLYESWLEIRPPVLKNQSTILTVDGAFTLKHILDIMEKLWNLVIMWQKEVNSNDMNIWFQQQYSRDFTSHLMDAFPYSLGDASLSGKKKKDEINQRDVQLAGGINCYWQNLSTCFMFCCLNSKIKGNDSKSHERILIYLSGLFSKWTSQHEELTGKLFKVMELIVLENGPKWNALKPQITSLLRCIITSYESKKLPKETQNKILELLCNTILRENLMSFYGNDIFTNWIENLPNMLLDAEISYHTLQTFTTLAKYNNRVFLESLRNKSQDVLNNLNKIIVTGIDNQFEGKKLVMNLFYWIQSSEILGFVDKMDTNPIKMYLHDIVELRM